MLFSRSSLKPRLLIMAGLALFAFVLVAQQAPQYSVDVNVVNVLATVRDKHGKIININSGRRG